MKNMNRKFIITAIVAILAVLLQVVSAMIPDVYKIAHPWVWQVPLVLSVILFLVLLFLILPLRLWHAISELFPIRVARILLEQNRYPSKFLHMQKPRFVFLPMSGGVNGRKWSYEFTIVSCLIRDLMVDRIDVEISYPISEVTSFQVQDTLVLTHLNVSEISTRYGNMSDTSFNYLAKESKRLQTKGYIDIRLKVTGYRLNKRIFSILEEQYRGELEEWGKNNDP